MTNWPNLPTVWSVKVGTYLIREEVFALKDVGFQLQQREYVEKRTILNVVESNAFSMCIRVVGFLLWF